MLTGAVAPLKISHASADPRFLEHPAPTLYGIESYIAVPLTRKDGSYFGTLCTLDPEPMDPGDEIIATFQLLSKLISFELEEAEEQRRRDDHIRALEDVIGIAGHDIRQPLTAVYAGLQLLARKVKRGQETDVAEEAEYLAATVRRAVTLSETLLDVAQTQVSGFILQCSTFDLASSARQVLEETRIAAPAHTLVLYAPHSLPVFADERRLRRMVSNLLDNAVKYAPADSGPIILELSRRETGPAQFEVHIIVSDSGLGVRDHQLPLLFERQYRASQALDQGIQGSGLGLYIVRQIVEGHDGRVYAEASPEGGLAIHVHLPMSVDAVTIQPRYR
ncbi:MAG: GAF domain-containing sensor histidine kinase [Chloroflexota bacterium]